VIIDKDLKIKILNIIMETVILLLSIRHSCHSKYRLWEWRLFNAKFV